MSARVIVVAEDRLGFELATSLCDRVVAERSEWLHDHWADETSRSAFRVWSKLDLATQQRWTTRADIKRLSAGRRQTHGLKAEGALVYKAVKLAQAERTEGDGERCSLTDVSPAEPGFQVRWRGSATRPPIPPSAAIALPRTLVRGSGVRWLGSDGGGRAIGRAIRDPRAEARGSAAVASLRTMSARMSTATRPESPAPPGSRRGYRCLPKLPGRWLGEVGERLLPVLGDRIR